MHDSDRRNADFLAHDDGPRPLINDHSSWTVGLYFEGFQFGDKLDRAAGIVGRDVHGYQGGILGPGKRFFRAPKLFVNRRTDPERRRKVGLVELEFDLTGWD